MKVDKRQADKKKDKPLKVKKNKTQTIQDLVSSNPHFQFIGSGKIRCKLTNHEMLGTIENYQSYIKSKSYRRGVQSQIDLGEYNQILIDHKGNPKFYYCQLTGLKIAKKKSVVDKHINGKRFKRAVEQFNKMQDEEGGEGNEQREDDQEQQNEDQDISQQHEQKQEEEEEEEEENQQSQKKATKIEKNIEKKPSRVIPESKQPKKNKKIHKDNKDKKNGKKQSKKVVKK